MRVPSITKSHIYLAEGISALSHSNLCPTCNANGSQRFKRAVEASGIEWHRVAPFVVSRSASAHPSRSRMESSTALPHRLHKEAGGSSSSKSRRQRRNTPKTSYDWDKIGDLVVKKLGLEFKPDDWQLEAVSKAKQGYDIIICAGTGYGKSLVFEAFVVLLPGKVIIVISPLKALEEEQVSCI